MIKAQFSKKTFARFLDERICNCSTSFEKLSRGTGLNASYLKELAKGTKPAPNPDRVCMIADALGLEGPERDLFYHLAEQSYQDFLLSKSLKAQKEAQLREKFGEPFDEPNWKRKKKKK